MKVAVSTKGGARPTVLICAAALAGAFVGCDRSTTPGAALGPSAVPIVHGSVVISARSMTFSPATYCARVGSLTPALNVVVSSTRVGFVVDQVTLHLIDGSNAGGPGVTFPQPDLNAQFVNTVVAAGSSRTFVFTPTFRCGLSAPRSIQGDVRIVDWNGGRSVMTASFALP